MSTAEFALTFPGFDSISQNSQPIMSWEKLMQKSLLLSNKATGHSPIIRPLRAPYWSLIIRGSIQINNRKFSGVSPRQAEFVFLPAAAFDILPLLLKPCRLSAFAAHRILIR
jgi:hypothetical protein